jgi:hypothetical protein
MSRLAAIGIFSDDQKRRIAWENVSAPHGTPYKIDCDGRVMLWDHYSKYTEYGWHIDHITPTVLGGADAAWNWRARHWRGNCTAGGRLAGLGRLFGI